ncbi:MAG: beta-ketoacyl-[acyl-carrier-protein] synthase family protein [Phycisphaerales bacterium]|nr:beta-ketoacyl-[acyl-carrier-protein] synthase family protein [Phycisphaerales bacterium]
MSARVVITGMGWVTPLGCDLESVWAKLLRGQSAVGRVSRFDASTFKTNFAAEVKGFRLEDHLGEKAAAHAHAGLNTQFALAAAMQAWKQSGLGAHARSGKLVSRRFGMYLGAGEGQLDFDNFASTNLAGWDGAARKVDARRWAEAAYRNMDAVREVEQEPNMCLSHVAELLGCRGPASNCMTACAASTQAVGEAFELLRHGDADVMIAGGAHTMIHPLGMTGFIRLTAMSRRVDDPEHAARPFDQTRDGFVMGEGAGMVVLETLEHAMSRGATPLCEVVGFGSTADAFRITDIQPDGKGGGGAMMDACRQAGISPREPGADGRPRVHYISAHGTGTKENDSIETKAVKLVFGPLAPKVPFSSVKSMLGHLIQAAGAVELITCVQAIRTGWIPATINLKTPDPACDLDHVPNQARDLNPAGGVDLCLSNSFGFGGQNDTIAVKRFVA